VENKKKIIIIIEKMLEAYKMTRCNVTGNTLPSFSIGFLSNEPWRRQ
jgi:hypothetical protein